MGLAWQQGPLAAHGIGRFLVPDPLPERLLYAEPLRWRMRVQFAGNWVADSEDVVLLHQPGHYPVAYFPLGDIVPFVLPEATHTTKHSDFGPTSWYTVQAGSQAKERAEFQTFCPYKGVRSYYDIGDVRHAAWSYLAGWPEVGSVAALISFEPDRVEVSLDGKRMRLEPGQSVVAHGIDRDLSIGEAPPGGRL